MNKRVPGLLRDKIDIHTFSACLREATMGVHDIAVVDRTKVFLFNLPLLVHLPRAGLLPPFEPPSGHYEPRLSDLHGLLA